MKLTKNTPLLLSQKIAGVILKPDATDLKDVYYDIKNIFNNYGIEILLEECSGKMIGETVCESFDTIAAKSDFLVTIGGDGTLISVARRSFKYNKPILGINLGTLGFLTAVLPEDLETFLKDFLDHNYTIDNRMMIETTININHSVAFNDIVIRGKSISHMIHIDAFANNKKINTYYGDGLIISTPTGSTAYNISSGGPVVYPLTEAFIVTPISAHSLTQRPLILPADFELELTTPNKEGAIIIVDGQDIYEIDQNESINIKIASSKAKLIRPKSRDYFEVLNQKLSWGD